MFGTEGPDLRNIKGHQFAVFIVELCCAVYVTHKVGLRTVVSIVQMIFNRLGFSQGLPCHQTVSNWVRSNGLVEYLMAGQDLTDKEYAVIADESIGVGGQKLLLHLGTTAKHPGHPLALDDITVLGMEVAPGWNADDVRAASERAQAKAGHPAEYSLSDCGPNLCKAFGSAGAPHLKDVSHSLGDILKKVFGSSDDFKKYTSMLGKKRLKHHLTAIAYLLPPNMRTIARFMNFDAWVMWSKDMLAILPSLPKDEKKAFSFLTKYEALIEELHTIVQCFQLIESELKTHGLSKVNAAYCVRKAQELLVTPEGVTNRMRYAGVAVIDYLRKQTQLVGNVGYHVNISSDIIESLFGVFKAKKSPDKLVGIRASILALPLIGRVAKDIRNNKVDFKENLESVRVKDVKEWNDNNLLDNLTLNRIKKLKNRA